MIPFLPQAVVFDCDGLLLETESRWTMAEERMCERWGVPFSMELKLRLLGTHADECGVVLADWFGAPPDEAPQLAVDFLATYREVIDDHGAEPMPGALELVERLAGRLPLAVASNTNLDDTLRVLRRSALPDEVFDTVVCAGGEVAPKPAPDVYLAACTSLGVAPAVSVAFEDSPVGSQAATAAGLFVFGVPFSSDVELTADLTISSLAELDPRLLAG